MKRVCALLCALALLIAGAAQAEEAYLEAYREALENLYYNRTFPDGSSDELANVEGNGFAVFDVDGDGRRELIIEWNDTAVACYRGLVLDYDVQARSLRTEYDGGANLLFYDDGAVEEPLSHNQGPSRYFWPYFLSRYDPELDVYESSGLVEAMEKSALEEFDWDLEFPESVDADGNGVVYSIDDGDWVDDAAYVQWRYPSGEEGSLQRIPYVSLTIQNIRDMR